MELFSHLNEMISDIKLMSFPVIGNWLYWLGKAKGDEG